MKKLSVFEFVTLNGFYKGPNEDISWHRHGGEEAQLSEEGLEQNNILLFGRKTYDVMVSFWPTPMAKQSMPKVAEGMNKAQKIVFSTTMKKADWQNTSVVREKIVEETKRLKQTAARDLTVLGSGTIVTQLAEAGLIDEYQIMIDPVLIGEGTPLFEGLTKKLDLKLTSTRTFQSGVMLLNYQPRYVKKPANTNIVQQETK